MAFKVNYGLERAERNRAKQAKKEAKLKGKKAAPAGTEPALEQAPTLAQRQPPETESGN